ncbi:MAG: 50S ribosomal protein L2 [Candidatus Colwellbacteria bacterium]|nr:50S ribosomal protein L2 [Candidatus Colwellbacteria bacterium]
MKTFRPTTPSRRGMTATDQSVLSRVAPEKRLLTRRAANAGRNNRGRITVRHQGGGVKRLYRLVDLWQNDKIGVRGIVETVEYDPYRTSFIMKVLYRDGDRRYCIAPAGISVGAELLAGPDAPLKPGNRLPLENIPVGWSVYNVEVQPGKGGQIVRSAGASAEILAHDQGRSLLKLPSGEVRKALSKCMASIGQVSNPDWKLVRLGSAGRVRRMGVRPTVRGSAMNPRDHPYGGGEGRQPRGTKRPKTKWGKITGGRKTRNAKKWSNALIVSRRTRKSRK